MEASVLKLNLLDFSDFFCVKNYTFQPVKIPAVSSEGRAMFRVGFTW